MANVYYVYYLIDPLTSSPFYVGKGKGKRRFDHLTSASVTNVNYRKKAKIQEIRDSGLEPLVEIAEEGLTEEAAYELEDQLILQFGRAGIEEAGTLTNLAIGRRRGPVTPEVAQKISDTKRGMVFSIEHREKLRTAKIGCTLSDDRKKKLRDSNIGRPCSLATRQKISKANSGPPRHAWSEESKAKLSRTLQGKSPHEWSEASRNKISTIQTGRPSNNKWTDETRAKLSKTMTGRTLSDEIRRKISETKRAKGR